MQRCKEQGARCKMKSIRCKVQGTRCKGWHNTLSLTWHFKFGAVLLRWYGASCLVQYFSNIATLYEWCSDKKKCSNKGEVLTKNKLWENAAVECYNLKVR